MDLIGLLFVGLLHNYPYLYKSECISFYKTKLKTFNGHNNLY